MGLQMSDCYWGITDTYVYNIREIIIIKVIDNHDDRITRKRRKKMCFPEWGTLLTKNGDVCTLS